MSTLESATVDELATRRELVSTADRLVPVLAEYADEGERLRRLPDPTVSALRDSGMFSLAVPRRYGGHGAGLRTTLEVTERLAHGDASAAWVAMVLTGGAYMAGMLDEQGRAEIWGVDAHSVIVGSLIPRGSGYRTADGGLLISGQWPWVSGAHAADWAAVAVNVIDEERNLVEPVVALVPAHQLTIQDTWHTAGMAATGSNTLCGEQVAVPAHRVLSIAGVLASSYADARPDEPYLRTPLSSLAALPLVGPMIGMASRALELTLETAKHKTMSLSVYETLAASPSAQLAVAEAATDIDSAQLHAHRAADDVDTRVAEHRDLTILDRARVRMDTGIAAIRCRQAVELLLSVTGAGAFALSNPVQRIWRDLGAASRHAACNPSLSKEIYGRALLGIEEQPSFLV